MTRHRERGSAAVYFSFALVLAAAVGLGVYLLIRDTAKKQATVEVIEQPKPVAPPPPPPVVEQPPPVVEPPPPTSLELAARDSQMPAESTETNTIVFGYPGVDGDLARDAVATVLFAQKARLQRCFTSVRASGLVRLYLVLDARGKVTKAGDLERNVDEKLARCMLDKYARTVFPSADEGTTVVIPIDVRYDG